VTRFMARHPVVAGCVLMLAHLAFVCAQSVMLYVFARPTPSDPHLWIVRFLDMCEWPVNGVAVFAVACWLTLLRRRSGQSAWPACWLALTTPVQLWLHWMTIMLGFALVLRGTGGLIRTLTDLHLCVLWFVHRSNYLAVPAALLGVLAGLGIARRRYEAGRWERVLPAVPVPEPLLARRPLLAAVVLTSPAILYANLLVAVPRWSHSDGIILLCAALYVVLSTANAFFTGLVVSFDQRRAGRAVAHLHIILPVVALLAAVAYVAPVCVVWERSRWSLKDIEYFFTMAYYETARPALAISLAASLVAARRGVDVGAQLAASREAETEARPSPTPVDPPKETP